MSGNKISTRNVNIMVDRKMKRDAALSLSREISAHRSRMTPHKARPMKTQAIAPVETDYSPGALPAWHPNYDRRQDKRFIEKKKNKKKK